MRTLASVCFVVGGSKHFVPLLNLKGKACRESNFNKSSDKINRNSKSRNKISVSRFRHRLRQLTQRRKSVFLWNWSSFLFANISWIWCHCFRNSNIAPKLSKSCYGELSLSAFALHICFLFFYENVKKSSERRFEYQWRSSASQILIVINRTCRHNQLNEFPVTFKR